jgi:hypothetical protein
VDRRLRRIVRIRKAARILATYEYVEPYGAIGRSRSSHRTAPSAVRGRRIVRLLNGDREREARAGTTSPTLWRGQITIHDREEARDYSARPSAYRVSGQRNARGTTQSAEETKKNIRAYRVSGREVREAHNAKCGGEQDHETSITNACARFRSRCRWVRARCSSSRTDAPSGFRLLVHRPWRG